MGVLTCCRINLIVIATLSLALDFKIDSKHTQKLTTSMLRFRYSALQQTIQRLWRSPDLYEL